MRFSPVFWAVLNVYWRIWGVFWCLRGMWRFSEAFWSILMGCECLWKVPEHSEVFSNILGYSEVFWGIWRHSHRFCVVSRRFLKVLTHSLMICAFFWSCSKTLSWILQFIRRFWGILWRSGVLRGVLRNYGFWIFQSIYETFTSVLCCSRVIWGVHFGSEKFLKVLCYFMTFTSFLRHSETFSLVLGLSEKILNVLPRSFTFWDFLRHSKAFRHVQIDFEWFGQVADGSE